MDIVLNPLKLVNQFEKKINLYQTPNKVNSIYINNLEN